MFQSYIKIALRSLSKNKLYAVINIVGLAIGMTMYLLSGLITDYERNHDHMFAERDSIYTISSVHNPLRNHSSIESRGTYLALQPLLKAQIPELVAASRGLNMEALLKSGENAFYQDMKFVDPDFTKMFDFEYIHGSSSSLTAPSQLVMTDKIAVKFFGKVNAVGETLMLSGPEGEYPMQVVAIIKEIAADSHFNSRFGEDEELSILALVDTVDVFFKPLKANENWGWLSSDYMTYVMTDGVMSASEINRKVNDVFLNNAPKGEFEAVSELRTRPLVNANIANWRTADMPVIKIVEYLGILVLVIAIINYANLATAQNMGRFREVGLRKTLGAGRKQLLTQFMMECQSIVFISLILAVAMVEIAVPAYNNALGKVLVIDYTAMLPWLLATTILVGIFAGSYPAFMITKTTPSEAIKNTMAKGRGGTIFRNMMIGTQFIISIVMTALVLVVFAQNQKVLRCSDVFPKSQIMDIQRIGNDKIQSRKDVLHREITALPDVENAAYSSQVPYNNQNWHWEITKVKGDFTNKIDVNNMLGSADFLKTYNIPIVAGRDFSNDISADEAKIGIRLANVIINEMAVEALGYESPEAAVGGVFYVGESDPYQLNIIGVMADRNILGLQNSIKPFVLRWRSGNYRSLSVKLKAGASADTITKIENIWKKVNPEFPMDWAFLDAGFEEQFKIMRSVNLIFAGFSALALALALFGLFGLAAFMAEQRTREIGVRKVHGAGTLSLVRMMIFQFSKPVAFAIVIAVPLAYLASDKYLNYFADKIDFAAPLIVVASIFAVFLSWGTIAVHAIKVARENPIKALRAE